MLRKLLRPRTLMAMSLPVILFGAAFAGGEDCHKKDGKAAVHAGSEKGSHCHLSMSKNISKTAKMTDDGAVVTLEGKTDEAVKMVKQHLADHGKGAEGCEGCPMTMDGVSSEVKMTDKGGKITLKGNSPETIKAVQDWAGKPAACCAGKESA